MTWLRSGVFAAALVLITVPYAILTLATFPLPRMALNPDVKDIFAFRYEDFELVGYRFHPHIPAKVAV